MINKKPNCHCGGDYKPYNGLLGYESLVCTLCGEDIRDYEERLKPHAIAMLEALKDAFEAFKDHHGEWIGQKGNEKWVEYRRITENMYKAIKLAENALPNVPSEEG